MTSWSFYDSGGWIAYAPEQAEQLESAFADGAASHVELDLGPRRKYRIDLDRMQQTNLHSNFARPVARSAKDAPADERWVWQETDGSWQEFNDYAQGQLSAAKRAGRELTILHVTSSGGDIRVYAVRLPRPPPPPPRRPRRPPPSPPALPLSTSSASATFAQDSSHNIPFRCACPPTARRGRRSTSKPVWRGRCGSCTSGRTGVI